MVGPYQKKEMLSYIASYLMDEECGSVYGTADVLAILRWNKASEDGARDHGIKKLRVLTDEMEKLERRKSCWTHESREAQLWSFTKDITVD